MARELADLGEPSSLRAATAVIIAPGFPSFRESGTMQTVDVPGKLRAWWTSMREWSAGKHFEIDCDDSGVALVSVPPGNEPPLRLKWEQIKVAQPPFETQWTELYRRTAPVA